MKVSFILALFLLSVLAMGVNTVGAQPVPERNQIRLVDTSDETVELMAPEFISDTKIDSMIQNNVIDFETNGLVFKDYSIDTTESSIGKHSTDWVGNPSDPSSGAQGAFAGRDFWIINGSGSPTYEEGSSAATDSDSSTTTLGPEQGGYYWLNTMYAAVDTDTEDEPEISYNRLEKGSLNGVSNSLTTTDYVYLNFEMTLTFDNTTGAYDPLGYISLIFSDSDTQNNNYLIDFVVSSGTGQTVHGDNKLSAAAGTWYDGADNVANTVGESPVAATGNRILPVSVSATSGTAVEYSILFNPQDIINSDPESADQINANFMTGFFTGLSSVYSNADDTTKVETKIKQLMLISEYKSMIFDDTTAISDLSTADKDDNLINGTTVSVDLDKNELESGDTLFPGGLPVNRLTIASGADFYLKSYEEVSQSYDHQVLSDSGTRTYLRFIDRFDLQWGAEEAESGMASADGFDINVTNIDLNWELDGTRGAIETEETVVDNYKLVKSDGSVDTSNFATSFKEKDGTSITQFSDLYDAAPKGPLIIDMVSNYEIDEGDDAAYQIFRYYSVSSADYAEWQDSQGQEVGIIGQGLILGKKIVSSPLTLILTVLAAFGIKQARTKKSQLKQWQNKV